MDGRLSGADGEDDVSHGDGGHLVQGAQLVEDPALLADGLPVSGGDAAAGVGEILGGAVGVGDHHGQGLKVAVALLPVILVLPAALPVFAPHQLLMDGVVHLDGQGREGDAIQGGVHAVEGEGLAGGQGDGGVLKGKVEFQPPGALSQCLAGAVVVVRVDRQILELDGGGARLEGLVLSHHLHELDGVVGGVGVIEPGGAVRPAAGCAHLSAVIAESQGEQAIPFGSGRQRLVADQGGTVVPADGVDDGVGVGVPHDGIGGDGDAVAGGAGPDGVADAVDDLRLGGAAAEQAGKGVPGAAQGAGGPRHPQAECQGGGHPHRREAAEPEGAADGGDRPGLHQAVHHLLLLLLGKVEPVHGIPIAVAHVIPSLSKSVRSCWRPRLSWVETVAGFSPRSWAISRAA